MAAAPANPANPPDQALLAAAESSKPAFLRDLAHLVDLDSGTDDAAGLNKVAALLAARLKELGFEVGTQAAPPAAGQNVVGVLRGRGTKKLMLMIHYDTVFGVGEATKRPFRVDGHKAYGPGVADAKGGALMILQALSLLRARGFDHFRELTVLFNPDEEKSSLGSRTAIRSLSAQQDAVLIFEPPDAERVIVATNGIAYVHLDVTGLAAHAGSAPEKGRNAALELAHQIVQLKDLGSAEKGTTVNWTMLQSGERANIIPDHAQATADMRMADVAEVRRVQDEASAIARRRLVGDTTVTVTVEERRPPFARNPASDHLAALAQQAYAELGRSLEPAAMRYGTDAGFAWHPGSSRPAVLDGLGIVGDRLHSPDEWADIDSIAPRLYLAVRLLEMLGQ
jgi:glutamate carboxypeptidase